VVTELNDRVISMELAQLRSVQRIVGVAGGKRKTHAIRGALAGKLINVLITDLASAERLLAGAHAEVQAAAAPAPRGRKTRKPR
jgi:DNA-binding transcriptional regulator LsrR (DeoR family)